MPDIQSQLDTRHLPIDSVGIKELRSTIMVRAGEKPVTTVGTWTMTVGLPAHVRGTHMSRFIELVESQDEPLDYRGFMRLALDMLKRLDAVSGEIAVQFPYFLRKVAPVSGVPSRMDYDVRWRGNVAADGRYTFELQVTVPVTSLCPCSKQISRYGAHNQRSHLTLTLQLRDPVAIEEVIAIAERSASCELYGLLKRPDEKYVTERAYDNPKFVEDLVRDVAQALGADPRIVGFMVTAENFESIHNHSAFARIAKPRIRPAAFNAGGASVNLEEHDMALLVSGGLI